MNRALKKAGVVIGRINLWLGVCSGLAAALIMLLTCFEVVMRYFLNRPTLWSVEISEYLLVACAYLGLAYTLEHGGHVRVELIIDRLQPGARRVLNIIAYTLAVIFAAVLTWQTLAQALTSLARGAKSSTPMAIPLFPVQILIPIGTFSLCLQALCMLYGYVTGRPAAGKESGSSEPQDKTL